MEVMSMEQLQKDIDFLAKFTERFANAVVCPVSREIPEKIKTELDEYLFQKKKRAVKDEVQGYGNSGRRGFRL